MTDSKRKMLFTAFTVTPAFGGFDLRIAGRNRNDIKELIHQSFSDALEVEVQ